MEPEQTIGQNEFQEPTRRSSLPLIAGILLILAGVSGLFSASMLLAMDPEMVTAYLPPNVLISPEQLLSFFLVCGVVIGILSIFTLVGGIVAVKRKAWGLAIIGSILGLFTIGPVFSATILSLIGLILIALSKKEFQ